MSSKATDGPDSCYNRALNDEPMFVLLGRDPTAPFVVLFWCKLRTLLDPEGKDAAQIAEAHACTTALRDWAVKLGKTDQLGKAYEAFRMACLEVAKAEFEAMAKAEADAAQAAQGAVPEGT